MGLLDDLRGAAAKVDPSLQPSSNEVGPLLGALIAYTEHGDKFLKAAESDNGAQEVSALLSGDQDTGPAAAGKKDKKDG